MNATLSVRLRNQVDFLKALARSPGHVGAIAPSSRHLAQAMLDGLPILPDRCVVELGPGTGSFTAFLRPLLSDPCLYLGIERDPQLANSLRRRWPELTTLEADAANLADHHARSGLPPAGCVLCSLPFGTMPDAVRNGVLEGVKKILAPGGVFRLFQYAHAQPMASARLMRRMGDEAFGAHTRSRPVWRNLPPAYVFTWLKKLR